MESVSVPSPETNDSDDPNDVSSAENSSAVRVSKDLAAAAGFNVETPIVSAIIGNITGTLPMKKNDANVLVRCEICNCSTTSVIDYDRHVNGVKHKKKLRNLDLIQQLKQEKAVLVHEFETSKSFFCGICFVRLNSALQMELHLLGAKHKKKVAKIENPETDTTNSENNGKINNPKKKKKLEDKSMTCNVCKTVLNSQSQYDMHIASRRHNLMKGDRIFSNLTLQVKEV